MATLLHTTEPIDQSAWNFQRDVFAPPNTRRIIRGWDRAPVSARAPRLHGQKVWKKVGLKIGGIEETQNESQDELEKEGAGARKRSRMLTTRENINNAMWVEAVPVEGVLEVGGISPSNGDQLENSDSAAANRPNISIAEIEGVASLENAIKAPLEQAQSTNYLQFVPRKRTNTDHVITPKKALQPTTSQHKRHASSGSELDTKADAKTLRPRRSLRKSMTESISDSAPKRRISRAQSRLSSSAEGVSNLTHGIPFPKAPVNELGGSNSKKRGLRRSTISKGSAPCIEESVSISDYSPNSAKSDQRDATPLGASVSVEPAPSEELFQPAKLDENPINKISKMCNSIGLDSIKPPQSVNDSPTDSMHVSVKTMSTQVGNTVHDQPQETLLDIGSDGKQVQELRPDNDASQLDTTKGQSSSAACMISHTSTGPAEVRACQATSMADDVTTTMEEEASTGPLTAVPSDYKAGIDSLENEDKFSLRERDLPSHPVSEVCNCSNIQKTEPPDAPKPSSAAAVYDHDDTDMLRNFLTRVKASKAANNPPKRKRSLPHSPLRIPLGDIDNNASPSPLQLQKESVFDVSAPSPSKRKKKSSPLSQCENEPEPRRSGRTKPLIKEPPGAPSFIPVRRLGQDIDTTVTLKRSEEKELAALTRINTRKNKGNAMTALEVLAKKSDEKEDPVLRQRLLKEVFDEKMEKGRQGKDKKGREKKSVTWAEELTRFHSLVKGKGEDAGDEKEKERCVVVQGGSDDKKLGSVKVGVRSKAALGMALNGTPAPKRKMRSRM